MKLPELLSPFLIEVPIVLQDLQNFSSEVPVVYIGRPKFFFPSPNLPRTYHLPGPFHTLQVLFIGDKSAHPVFKMCESP